MIIYDGYVWEMADDPICDDDGIDCYEDCTECPNFADCFMIVENAE